MLAESDCPNPEVHGNPFRYCPSCSWIEPATTPTVTEVLTQHPWHVTKNDDGVLNGVCLGCFENGVLPRFDTWAEFAEHLAGALAEVRATP